MYEHEKRGNSRIKRRIGEIQDAGLNVIYEKWFESEDEEFCYWYLSRLQMKDSILSIVRHALTFGGGVLVAKGWISEHTLPEIIGAISSLIGVIWGASDEWFASKKPSA